MSATELYEAPAPADTYRAFAHAERWARRRVLIGGLEVAASFPALGAAVALRFVGRRRAARASAAAAAALLTTGAGDLGRGRECQAAIWRLRALL